MMGDSMGEVHIRWAQADYAGHMHPLMRALYAHDMPDAPDPSPTAVSAHVDTLLRAQTPHRLAVAWDGTGTAIGLAAVGIFASISDPRPENRWQMELKELFVLPGHRGRGIGAALMTWVERRARERSTCRLDWHVKRDNLKGIAFYERIGAAVVVDRISMRKWLNRP